MRTYLISILILILLTSLVIAQEELVRPRVLPDNPLYPIKKFIERIWIWVAFNPEAKAYTRLGFAEYRLAEAKAMIEKGKPEFVEGLKAEYEKEISECSKEADRAAAFERNVTVLAEHIAKVTQKHLRVLENLLEKVPVVARVHIEYAINTSSKGHFKAIKKLLEVEQPDLAHELISSFAEERMKKAKKFLEKRRERFAEIVLEKYDEGLNESEKIEREVEAMGRDISLLAEHVCNMTYKHIEVLQKVLENVSEEAKPVIERVIDAALERHGKCQERMAMRVSRLLERVRGINCTTHTDCLRAPIFCPMAIGYDTPMCRLGRCTCGPRWKLNRTEWREIFEEEMRPKMEEIFRKMKERYGSRIIEILPS